MESYSVDVVLIFTRRGAPLLSISSFMRRVAFQAERA